MPRWFGMTVKQRAGAVAVSALLAVGAALAPAPGSDADAAQSVGAGPPRASASTVIQALGISNVPAEIVILVDISLSMAPEDNGLYPTVRQQVLAYLGVLAQQDPQDLVGVILFGKRSDNQVTDPGPPSRHIWLPEAPYSQETDFGWAFQQAVQMFKDAPPDIKAGGVLLLSDGEVSVPAGDDPAYGTGFTAPGWKKLRTQVQNLPMTVTGYDVPLTSNTTFTGNQYQALSQVFQPVQSLPYGTTDLSRALNLATQGILDSEVASAAAPDIGPGVRVAWSGLRGVGGRSVDLGTGQAEVTVTVTATTRRIPVYLNRLSVTSTGLPVTMKGALHGDYALAPGQSAAWNVRLTWHPRASGGTMTGGPRTLRGKLRLDATVSSPFTPTLQSTFGDTAFSIGGIQTSISPQFPATEPTAYSILLALGGLLIIVVLLVGGCAAAACAWLSGTLMVAAADGDPRPVRLRGWRVSKPTGKLIEKPGRMIVRGSPIRRRMKVDMRIDGRPRFSERLLRGKSALPAGIEVVHQPRARLTHSGGAAPASSGPDGEAGGRSDNDG